MVFPASDEATVYITHPTALKWTKDNHMKRFPKMYKDVVTTVLKCHYRWQNMVYDPKEEDEHDSCQVSFEIDMCVLVYCLKMQLGVSILVNIFVCSVYC